MPDSAFVSTVLFSTAELQIGRSEGALSRCRCRCWCRNWNPKPTPTTWHHVQISYARFCTILIFIQHLRFKWSRSCSWSLSCSWSCSLVFGFFSFEFGDGDAQQIEICVWVRWGYVAIEWSRWTWKAWKKSTTATTSSRPLQSIFKSPARIDNVSPAVAQRVCGPEKLTDRHRDWQGVRGEGWQSQAATPVEDAFNASVTLQQLHRYLRLAVSIKNSSKYCQNKYDVINEQPVAFRHWLKLFIHCLPARQCHSAASVAKVARAAKVAQWHFWYLQKCELYFFCMPCK